MKTISSFLLAMCMLISTTYAGSVHSTSIDPRVLKAFSLTFPSVTNAKWFEYANGFTVAFTSQQVSVIAHYDKEGELIKVRRSYQKEQCEIFQNRR